MRNKLRIVFLHPDLGLGGAERVVVDAALEMQARGHSVTIYTTHHDRQRCFEETRDGTLDVVAAGSGGDPGRHWRAPLAIWRMARLAREVVRRESDVDVLFCDLVAHIVPILRRSRKARILFYCHYPDRLLARRDGGIYRLYRFPIDRAEEEGLRRAHRIVANSRFTASAFERAFPGLGIDPEVLYPGVSMPHRREASAARTDRRFVILCLSRFDPGKNVGLALEAFARLRDRVDAAVFGTMRVVIAGSCDMRLPEQPATLTRLRETAERCGVASQVEFRVSVSDEERLSLLDQATCFVYTASEEHFGLGPVEAMAAGLPVVAADSGGVRETVRSGETGLLCPPTPEAFADALHSLISAPEHAREMGAAGRARVERAFSREAFGARLDAIVHELCGKTQTPPADR